MAHHVRESDLAHAILENFLFLVFPLFGESSAGPCRSILHYREKNIIDVGFTFSKHKDLIRKTLPHPSAS